MARTVLFLAASILSCPGLAFAGPPYVTDDPEPTRRGGWENYIYLSGTDISHETAGQAGLELNYGPADDLQLSLTLPVDFDKARALRTGVGDVDIGAKYRFLQQSDRSWLPDVAVFPSVGLPTARHAFGTGLATLFLPVWMEWDFGDWSTFGGGGYELNRGNGQRDFGLVGWAITRSLGKRLSVGVEIYHQTSPATGSPSTTNLGIGVTYQFTKHWALMASGGPGIQSRPWAGQSAFYASLQFTN